MKTTFSKISLSIILSLSLVYSQVTFSFSSMTFLSPPSAKESRIDQAILFNDEPLPQHIKTNNPIRAINKLTQLNSSHNIPSQHKYLTTKTLFLVFLLFILPFLSFIGIRNLSNTPENNINKINAVPVKTTNSAPTINQVNNNYVHVETGYFKIAGPGIARYIETRGIGDCIAVILYDNNTKFGLLAHCFTSSFFDDLLEKGISKMNALGVNQNHITAQIIGGMSSYESSKVAIAKLKKELKKRNIDITHEDTLGNKTREIIFDTNEGTASTWHMHGGKIIQTKNMTRIKSKYLSSKSKKVLTRRTYYDIYILAPFKFNSADCPDFMLESSKLAPHIAQAIENMKENNPIAFHNLQRIDQRGDFVIVDFLIPTKYKDRTGKVINGSKQYTFKSSKANFRDAESIQLFFKDYIEYFKTKLTDHKNVFQLYNLKQSNALNKSY